MVDTSTIIGHGVDADPSRRPGVPRERPPRVAPGAVSAEPQRSDVEVLKSRVPEVMTPVYGTAQPPAGLAGTLRRVAYAYPDHWARHWMLLLLADRVDVWEHRMKRPSGVIAMGALLAAGGVAFTLVRRRA